MDDKLQLEQAIAKAVEAAKNTTPLAGSITNNVTIDFVANAQLACGGSAAMVYLTDEGETLADISQSIYINAGTQIPSLAESVPATAARCVLTNTPWVLDPVGIGIGSQRTQILKDVKEFKPAIVRGNASEVIALAQLWELPIDNTEGEANATQSHGPKGVDSTDEVMSAYSAARAIANYAGGAVAVSGESDLVVDSSRAVLSEGGSAYMPKVTGFGCSLGGVCAVYAAVAEPFVAALTATNIYNAAGAFAHGRANGPASFKVEFIDALYNLSPQEVAQNTFRIL